MMSDNYRLATCIVCGKDDLDLTTPWRRVNRGTNTGLCGTCATDERVIAWDKYHAEQCICGVSEVMA